MRELKLVRSATGRLRKLGFALAVAVFSFAIAMLSIPGANSSATGALSEIDYALEVNQGSDKNQFAAHPDPNFTNGQANGTWEAWVFPTRATGTQAIFSKNTHYAMGTTGGKLWATFSNGSAWRGVTSNVDLPINQWSHVAYVKVGEQVWIYLNGYEVAYQGQGAFATTWGENNGVPFNIGRRSNGEFFSGQIDEVRVWNANRLSSIASAMHQRVPGNSSGLTGYWDFNEPSGATAYDRTTGSYIQNLTLQGSPTRVDVKKVTSVAGGDTVVTFPRTYLPGVGGWQIPSASSNVRALVVAGGGGGGFPADNTGWRAAGGGAGGLLQVSGIELQGSVEIVVGMGGRGGIGGSQGNPVAPESGQLSKLGSLSVLGGGRGGSRDYPPLVGGSGGGGSMYGGTGAAGSSGQGFRGGDALAITIYASGGGGGAGGPGGKVTGTSNNDARGGDSGAGLSLTISGTATKYAWGGAGAGYFEDGIDWDTQTRVAGRIGPANTGAGGGGGEHDAYISPSVNILGGAGGSGVVIVRYTPAQDLAWFDELDPNSNLTVPSGVLPITNNNSFMVQMWIKPDPSSTDVYQPLWSQADSGNYTTRYALYRMNNGRFLIDLGGTDWEIDPAFPTSTDWMNVALVVDHPGVRLYLNGVLAGSITNYDNGNRNSPGTVFSLGSVATGEVNRFSGWIDEVKVFLNGVPSDETIRSMMNEASTPGIGLAAYYDFNEVTVGQVLDRSGNGKHLVASAPLSLTNANQTSAPIVETTSAFGTQTVQKFLRSYITSVGGWTPPVGVTRAKGLVVGGGGGGSRGSCSVYWGAGAGGGQVTGSLTVSLSPTSPVSVVVGKGGARSKGGCSDTSADNVSGKPGQQSEFGSLKASGGSPSSNSSRNGGASGAGLAGGVVNSGYDSGGGGGATGLGNLVNGGAGLSSNLTGTSKVYGAGGPGRTGASGIYGTYAGVALSAPSSATHWDPNSGGGGTDHTHGADGVVILSYGPYLEVTRSPIVARVGSAFDKPIQIQLTSLDGSLFSSNSPVTVTASPNVLQINGQALTQSLTVNAVNGIATFNGLGFQAGVTSAQTLTFTSDAFVGTTLTVNPRFMPSNVNIANGVTTGGVFHEGLFFANTSSGTTNILASDLTAHMSSFSTLISASGNITVTNGFTSASTSDLILRAAGAVEVLSSQTVRTHGGDLVLWSDADSSGGGVIRLLGGAQLCTTGGTCGTTATGGGDVILGGGAAEPTNPMRPSGYAMGSGAVYSGATTTTTGVQIGTLGTAGAGASLYSAGGLLQIRGQMASNIGNFTGAGIAFEGSSIVDSGQGNLRITGLTANSGGTGEHGTIFIGASSGGVQLTSGATSSDAIVIEGIETGAASNRGFWGSQDSSVISSSGGLTIRANHVNADLDLNLNVVGGLVIEPYTNLLRNSQSGTNFDFKVGTANEFDLITTPRGIRIGSLSNSNQVSLTKSFSSEGPIEVYAARVEVSSNVNITNSSSSSRILFRATDWINIRSGSNSSTFGKIQTKNGDIILWSDADNSGDGSIYLGSFAELNSADGVTSKTASGGGRITLAGSFGNSNTDADGHPLGAAADTGNQDSGSAAYALVLQENSKIYSGGGAVTIRGRSNANQDVIHANTSVIHSGTGAIRVSAVSLNGYLGLKHNSSWFSAATSSPAIEVSVNTTRAGAGIANTDGYPFQLVSLANTGGGISISSQINGATSDGIDWHEGAILSRAGDIHISTSGQLFWSDSGARAIASSTSGDVLSSSANVLMSAQAFEDNTANSNSVLSTSGAVTISPVGVAFNASSEINFDVNAGSFTFGDVTNVNSATNLVKVSRDVTAAGPISLAGLGITIDRGVDIVSSAVGAPILFKSKGWIDVDNSTATLAQTNDSDFSIIQSNNGDIIFWADSDSNQEGLIWVAHNTRINSANGVYSYDAVTGGGNIFFAGGADNGSGRPAGSAWETGFRSEAGPYTDLAIGFGKFVDVFSGGGDIVARATKKFAGGVSAFHFQSLGEFVSGLGRIVIDAEMTASANVEAFEYWSDAETEAGALFSSYSTAQPAISISARTATIGAGGTVPIRLYNQNSANPTTIQSLASSGGGISIAAMNGVSSTNIGTYLAAVNLLSRNGAITFTSNAQLKLSEGNFTQFWGERSGTSVSNSVAPINLNVHGILSDANSITMSTSGEISVLPFANNFGGDIQWRVLTYAGDGFTIGANANLNSATHDVNIYRDIFSGGPISIFGDAIALLTAGTDIVSRGSGDPVLLKSRTFIENTNGTSGDFSLIQSNNGDIIFWPNATDAGTGNLFLGTYTQVNSANGAKSKTGTGGGRVTMAGGSSVDSDGHPTGSFPGRSGRYALVLEDFSEIYSGGGQVFINVRSNIAEVAALLEANSLIWSGTGQIKASISSTVTHASRLHMSWVSASTLEPAIELKTSVANNSYAMYNDSGFSFTLASIGNTGGGISTSAITPSAGNTAHFLYGWSLESITGDIYFYTNGLSNLNSTQARFFGARASGEVTSSSADIFITTQNIPDSTGNTLSKVSTSGLLSIQPAGNTFTSDTRFRFDIEVGALKIGDQAGRSGYTNTFTVDRPMTISRTVEIYANRVETAAGATITSQQASGGVTLSANANVQLGASVTSVGGINIYGQDIYLTPTHDLIATGYGSAILLKATRDIWSENGSGTSEAGHSKIQTNNGDIILWADSDANSAGGVILGRYFQLNSANGARNKSAVSGGGDIVIGGGSSADSAGYPTGFAGTGANWITSTSVFLYYDFGVFTGGGDFIVRGRSSGIYGILLYPFTEIFTGTGRVEIEGQSTSTGGSRGLAFIDTDFTNELNGPIDIVSHGANEPAVRLVGRTAGSGEGVRLYGAGSQNIISVVSSAASGGGIQIEAASSNSAYATYFRKVNLLSRNGEISVNGGTKILSLDWASEKLNYFGSRPGNAYVNTSSADIRLSADSFDFDFDSTFYNTSGDVEFVPATSNAFSSDQTFGQNVANAGSLTIGNFPIASDTPRTVTITNTQSVSGAIRLNAGNLVLNSTAPLRGGSIALNAQQSIRLLSSELTTYGGDITLWSNATNAGNGSIRFEAAMNATTNGGDFTVAGGLDDGGAASGISGRTAGDQRPDGYATDASDAIYRAGVEFTTGRNIRTQGGDVFIAASGGGATANSNDRYGMFSAQGVTNAGTGRISIWANLRPGTRGDYNYPWFGAFDTTRVWNYVQSGRDEWLSAATNGVAIDINVNASNGSGQLNSALNAELPIGSHQPGFRVAATGVAGSVRIQAVGGQHGGTRGDGMGAPVHLQYAEILAASGDVQIDAALTSIGPSYAAVSLGDTTNESRPTTEWINNDRVYLGSSPIAGSPVSSSSGDVVIRADSVDMWDGYSETRRVIVSTSGTLRIEPRSANFRNELSTRGLELLGGNLVIGKPMNGSSVLLHASHPISTSGSVTIQAGSITQNGTITASSILLSADLVALGANLRSTTGPVEIRPQTQGRTIDLGTETANRLSLTQVELSRISAGVLRIGSTQSGGISISANISLSSNSIGSLKLTSGGAVTAPSNVVLTAPNLAIDAGGGVNLPGSNSVSGAVAISASSMVTYSSAVSYSPSAVDGVTPVFGVGTAISQTNSPTTEEANEFLAVAFNPPPQFAIRDAYSKVLDANNRLAYSYTLSASVASGSGTVTGLTSSSRVGGLVTFNNLRVTSGVGVYAFTISATLDSTTLETRSANYNVMAGEPGQLEVIASTTSAQAGKTGLGFTVIVRDAYGNAITAGDHKNISVSASISGATAALVSGGEVRANDAGIATFSNLVVSGSVSDTIGITFKVTYTSLANALTTVTSSETIITLTPGDASNVLINTAAAGAGSGVAFTTQPQISVVDAYGNTVKGVAYSISASVSAGVNISPATATANTVSGIATFVGSSISGTVGNYSISYRVTSAGGNAIQSAEQSIALSWGNASRLSVSATALTATNRVTLNQLTVNVLDASGNTVGDGSQLIQATVSSALLTGTTQVFASGGVATFNNALTISGQVGTHTLVFSASGVASASVTVTLNHGAAASASLTVSANARNAKNFDSQPVVRILDADGNLVTTGPESAQTVELVVSPGSLTGTTAISASGGVATFAGVGMTGTAGSHTLTGQFFAPSTVASNQVITLSFGDATKLTLETTGVGAASGIALSTQPVLRLRDSSNNIVTGVAHNIVATVSPAVSISGETVAVDTTTGTATFTALSVSGTVGSYSISFSVEGASSSSVASVSQAVQLTHGAAQSLRVVSQPASGTAGLTLSPLVVEVIDHRGNRVTTGPTSSLTIEVTSASFGNVSGTSAVSLSSGVATFNNLSIDTSNANQALNFSVAGFTTGSTSTFTLAAGAATKLVITSAQPVDKKAGEAQANALVVEIQDEFDNTAIAVSSISLTVQAVSSSDTAFVAKSFSVATISPGASSVSIPASALAIQNVGSYRIKLSATSLTSALSNTFAISNAAASKLVLLEDVPASVRSGLTFSPAVQLQVRDQFDNPVLDSVTTVSTTVVSGSYKSLAGTTASNQLGSSVISLPNLAIEALAGNKKFRFSAASNSQGANITHIESRIFNVTFGESVRLSASATTLAVANRVSLPDIDIFVLDSAGNTVTDSSAMVEASVSGIALGGTKTRYAASGQVTFGGLALSGNIGNYDLGFSSTGLVTATVSVTVTHGAADYLTLASPSSVNNAISFGADAVVARIYDADGNLVTTGEQSTQTVALSAQGGSLTGTTGVSASAGIATFSNVVLTGLVGTKTLSATIQLPTQISTSSAIELQPGNPYRLELTQAASGFSNREVFGAAPIVTVEDVSGNTVPTPGMDIRVTVSTASISGSVTASAQTGIATFASNLVLRGTAGSHTLLYEAEGTSSSGVISTSQAITLNHGAASQLVITTAIANALSGVDFGTQPRVELRDPEGNRVSTSNQANATVEVSYSGAVWDAQTKQGVTLTGTRAISLSAGVGHFSGLRLSGVAGNYSLDFTFIEQSSISVSGAVTLEPGNATGISVVQGPQDVIAGERFAQSVSAEIIDDYYNRVTRVTSSATLVANLKSATNSALISTSPEFTAQNGLVIFDGLTFESAGSRFVQFAPGASSSLPNLSAITSTTFVITHAAPSSLQWVTQPATSVANDSVIAGQGAAYPELRALDRFGNLVNTGTVSYTAEVTSTPAPQSFTGVNSDGVLGVGTFQNLKLRATVGDYTIRFKANTDTNASYFASISHTIEVVHGVPTQVVATTHPSAVRAGVNFATQPVIEIRDSAGNRVSSSNALVSITATGADLTGQTQVNAENGIASFTTVQLSGSISGAVTLNYAISHQSQTISTSESVNLTPGLAYYMVLDWTAADIQTRAAISPAPVVRLFDEFGNLVTLDNATQVTAKLYRLGSLVTTSAQVFTASAGVVDFTGLTFIAEPNQGYSIQFEATGLSDVSSSAVTILPGPVDRVEIVTEPGTGAGVTQTRTGDALTIQPKLQLVDFDGNVVTTVNSGSVTAAIASGTDGQVISASVSVSAGIAQFTELGLIGKVEAPNQPGEIYRLEFSYNGITSSPSAQLTLKHNVAHKIVQMQAAVGGPAGLGFLTQPKVKVVDRFGNTVFDDSAITILAVPEVASGTGGVTVALSNQAITGADGTATFNMGLAGLTSNTYKLVFRDDQDALIPASQSGIVITHGEARQLFIARAASATDSNSVRSKTGEALKVQPVIEVRDDWGNRVLNSSHMITVSLSSTVRGARDYLRGFTVSAAAGIATFSNLALIGQPEASYQLTYKFIGNASALTQPQPIWVTHADAEYITIERQPQGGNKTGNSLSLSPIVTVRDFDGNPTTMLVGQTVSASITQGAGSITVNGQASLVGGVATFSNLTIVALPGENQRLTFTLNGYQNSASQTVTSVASNEISVTFNDPHKLALIQQPSANAVTAELLAVQPKVVVQDLYGNTVSNYVGSVFVQSQNGSRLVGGSDETISSLSALVVNGVAEFSSIRIVGPANSGYTLDFNSGALQSTTSNPVVLTHTTAHSLEIVTQPTGAVTGTLLATQPSVRILDRFGNALDTNNSAQVSVTVASGPNRPGGAAAQISGSTTVTVASGVATFSGLKFTGLVNSDYVFRFATSGISVDSNPVRVTSAGADSFEWVQLPVASRTGDLMPTPAVLRVLDFDGNLAVSSSDTVTVTVTGGGYIESGTTSQIVDGYVTFSNLVLVATPGVPQQLTFTATTAQGSFATSTTQSLIVTHTDASELRVNQSPNQVGQQGAAFTTQPKIFLYDRYGNKAIYDNSTVVTATVASGTGGAVSGSSVVTAVGGEANFASLALTGSPGVAYTLKYSVGNSYHVVDSTVLRVFKTAEINVAYPSPDFSLSATVAPTVAYTDSTENPLVFTSSTTQFCTVNSSTGVATIVAAGTCVIRVEVESGPYYKQNVLDVNLVIQKADQTPLVMTSPNFVDYGQVLTLTHSGGSGTSAPEYSANGTCRAFGNQLMMFGDATEDSTASCTVRVIQDGDANFEGAFSPGQRITVRKIAQAPLSIGNSRQTSVGDVDLFTVGGSGPGTVTYQVSAGVGTATCSIIDGTKLRATSNGWCEVSAQKNASVNYNTASSPVVVFTFSKQVQVVTFTSATPGMLLPGQSYQLAASASSGLTVSFAVTRGLEVQASAQTSYSPAICSLTQNTVTLLGTGTCEITATQAGNSKFASATAKLVLTVGQLNQVITFPQPDDLVYGTPTARLTAQASSGLPVRYTTSAGVTACTVSTDGLLTLTSAGDCSVIANQPGDGRYAAAAPVTRIFTVTPDQASSPALVSAAVGNQWFTVGYTQPSYTGGSNIIGYRLEVTDLGTGDRYVNSACSTTAPLSCTMVGIPNSRTYSARVAAITAAGVGRYSSATAALVPTNAEISVTQLKAGISGADLVMQWTPPAAVAGTFLRYDIYVWPQGSTPPSSPTTTVSTLSATSTAVPVATMTSSGNITQSSNVSQPVFVNAFQVRSRVLVFGAINQGPVGFIRLASSQSQVATASNLVGYEMRVVTVTDQYASAQTINTAMGVKLGLSTPDAPTQLTLDTTDPTKIIASWGAPNFDGGFPIADYEVRSNGQVICANIQVRMCEISPLTQSTLYRIEVRARSGAGLGAAASAQHTTPTPPAVTLNSGTELLVRLPVMQNFIPKLARPGQIVEVAGNKLNVIKELRLGGVKIEFTAVSATELRFRVPLDTKPGTYNIEHYSEFGKVIVIDALTVVLAPATESPVTESPVTESPVTESPEPGDTESPEVPGDSGSGSSGSGGSGSNGSGSTGGSSGGSSSGGNSSGGSNSGASESPDSEVDNGGSEPESTDSEIALPDPEERQPISLLWILLLALVIAGASYWLLARRQSERS